MGGGEEGALKWREVYGVVGGGAVNELLPPTSVTRLSLESAAIWLIGCQVVPTWSIQMYSELNKFHCN